MCGIAGRICSNSSNNQAIVKRMCDRIIHRGPDDEGMFSEGIVALGQRRLSIIDLRQSATAPLSNEDGTVWTVFNGEIYNFQTLRKQLEVLGHVFRTRTDTEVIVHAYEEWGVHCFEKLEGMFAIAVWDKKEQSCVLARDRLGKKPLMYARTSQSLVFASEIQALLAAPEICASPKWAAIDLYLSYGYIPSPLSAFEGVEKLEPGSWIKWRSWSIEHGRYWSPPSMSGDFEGSYEDAVQELSCLLEDAVRKRLVSDVPLGALLSGGLDSTTVVALMSRLAKNKVKTFSIGFEEAEFSELGYARILAEIYGTEHREYIVKPDVIDVLPQLVTHYGEPYADSSAIPSYYVTKMARQEVTVALTGDGGDESFAGYPRYWKALKWEKYAKSLRRLSLPLCALGKTLKVLPYSRNSARAMQFLQLVTGNVVQAHMIYSALVMKQEEKNWFLSTEYKRRIASTAVADPLADWEPNKDEDYVQAMQRHDQRYCLPDRLMVKSDIASMANSLELRCPFLDYRIVEFAAMLPTAWKCDSTGGKLLVRDMANQLLPKEIIQKPKSGFAIPVGEWFRGALNDWFKNIVFSPELERRKIYDTPKLKRMVDDHCARRQNWHHRLYAVVMLELWFREFID